MHQLLKKTLGGLSAPYYIRQFLFGLAFPTFIIFMTTRVSVPIHVGMIAFMVISTLLYPYSRFVYESVAGYLMGRNIFFLNAFVLLFVKFIAMMLCWVLAIFMAPIGLAYLYFHHSIARG